MHQSRRPERARFTGVPSRAVWVCCSDAHARREFFSGVDSLLVLFALLSFPCIRFAFLPSL
ncbi:hypothetical protein B0H13DRAFT_2183166 [Mycena leptocephala]|nr:hypothetical protein B0H13DRAFT_2183166 [Mycena leptocephala]